LLAVTTIILQHNSTVTAYSEVIDSLELYNGSKNKISVAVILDTALPKVDLMFSKKSGLHIMSKVIIKTYNCQKKI
jgi:hypothetical protein